MRRLACCPTLETNPDGRLLKGAGPVSMKRVAAVVAVVAALVAVKMADVVAVVVLAAFLDTLVQPGVLTLPANGMDQNSHGYVYTKCVRAKEFFKGV